MFAMLFISVFALVAGGIFVKKDEQAKEIAAREQQVRCSPKVTSKRSVPCP